MEIKIKQQSDFKKLELGIDYAFTLVENKDTNNQFSIMHYTMGVFSEGPNMHIHDEFDQIFIVTKGSPTFIVNTVKKKLDFGGIVVAPKGIPHNVINETDEEVSYIMILRPGGFENYFKDISNKLESLSNDEIEILLKKYGERPVK